MYFVLSDKIEEFFWGPKITVMISTECNQSANALMKKTVQQSMWMWVLLKNFYGATI